MKALVIVAPEGIDTLGNRNHAKYADPLILTKLESGYQDSDQQRSSPPTAG